MPLHWQQKCSRNSQWRTLRRHEDLPVSVYEINILSIIITLLSHEHYDVWDQQQTRLFVPQVIQANDKGNIKAHHLLGETSGTRIPLTTEALKGHRVVWKIEICYLIRMT